MKLFALLLVSAAFLGTAPVQADSQYVDCPHIKSIKHGTSPVNEPTLGMVWKMSASQTGMDPDDEVFNFTGYIQDIAPNVVPIANQSAGSGIASDNGKASLQCN